MWIVQPGNLIEPFAAPEIFVQGLAGVEFIGMGYRLHFCAMQSIGSEDECAAVVKLVVPNCAITPITDKLLTLRSQRARPRPVP